jgi:hypothetical protein
MHIVAAALDQKPVESKQPVHDLSTICRICWFLHTLGEARGPFHTSRQRVLHAESQTSSALACLEVL